jgi:hypothetical protein
LGSDFWKLKEQIRRELGNTLESSDFNVEIYVDQLIEELLRYLYLVADNILLSVKLSPSELVERVFQCLLMDPELYFNLCDALLNKLDVTVDKRACRVLPHDPLDSDNYNERKLRYDETTRLYESKFNHFPPTHIWSDYLESHEAAVPVAVAHALVVNSTETDELDRKFIISVQLPDVEEEMVHFKIDHKILVSKLKTAMFKLKNIAIHRQQLTFNGVILADGDTVMSYNVRAESVLELTLLVESVEESEAIEAV